METYLGPYLYLYQKHNVFLQKKRQKKVGGL